MKKYKIPIMVFAFIVITLTAAAYLSLLDYPRIGRSAYYGNPCYAFKAFGARYFTSKKYGSSKAIYRVKEVGLVPAGNPKFLCLLHEPNGIIDKPIADRYFNLLVKAVIKTEADSFWEVSVPKGLAFVEADTGRIIYLENCNAPRGSATARYYEVVE